jgi:hypothetical protein
MQALRWSLVFNAPSLEHLAERDIDAGDVVNAIFGGHGVPHVRFNGSGHAKRWFVVAPRDDGSLLTCIFRTAHADDLEEKGALVVPARSDATPHLDGSMRFCVAAWMSAPDEVRSYRNWRRKKGKR